MTSVCLVLVGSGIFWAFSFVEHLSWFLYCIVDFRALGSFLTSFLRNFLLLSNHCLDKSGLGWSFRHGFGSLKSLGTIVTSFPLYWIELSVKCWLLFIFHLTCVEPNPGLEKNNLKPFFSGGSPIGYVPHSCLY